MASCLTPFTIKNKMTNESIGVPCGKCPACFARRISYWSFRLMQEEKRSISAHFITLTYDTNVVPITSHGFMALNKRDVQLFFKRLRKDSLNTGRQIKYYLCGEYGGKTMRPHYHAILFNCDVQTIQRAWNNGSIHYGTVSHASVGYTLKYMSKMAKIPLHKNDDRQPEFSLMSKGLGANYLSEKIVKWHLKDLQNRMYCNIEDGKKIGMPRYYKQKIYSEEQRKAISSQIGKVMEEELQKNLLDPMYYRNKFEADKASFQRMSIEQNSINRNKI